MKKSLMQDIRETFAEALELGFHYDNTGIKCKFIRFLEMFLVKTVHQRILNSILIKIFDRLLQSGVFVSTLEKKISAQSPLSQFVPVKSFSRSKIENVASMDDQLIASLSPLDTETPSKELNTDSTIHYRSKSRLEGKVPKRHSR